jgi:hypothetical protein
MFDPMTLSFGSGVSLRTCVQLGRWLDQRFGPATSHDSPASDRLGIHAGQLVAHDLVATRGAEQGMVDVFAAMHSCIDDWLETSPVQEDERRLIKRRAVRAGVIHCWTTAAELRPDDPRYLELMEQTCKAVMVAELAEEQLGA